MKKLFALIMVIVTMFVSVDVTELVRSTTHAQTNHAQTNHDVTNHDVTYSAVTYHVSVYSVDQPTCEANHMNDAVDQHVCSIARNCNTKTAPCGNRTLNCQGARTIASLNNTKAIILLLDELVKEDNMKNNTIGNNVNSSVKAELEAVRPTIRIIGKGVKPSIGQIIAIPMTDKQLEKFKKMKQHEIDAVHAAEAAAAEKKAKMEQKLREKEQRIAEENKRAAARRAAAEARMQAINELNNVDETQHPVKEFDLVWDDENQIPRLVLAQTNSKRFGPAGELACKLTGNNSPLFTVVSKIDNNLPEYAQVKMASFIDKLATNGIRIKGGKIAKPVIMGTNALMANTVHYGDASIVDAMREFQFCGADMSHATKMAKLAAYGGLVLPFTRPVYGGILSPRMEALIPAWDHEIEAVNDLYDPDGTITRRNTTTICEFDGMAIYDPSEELVKSLELTEEDEKRIMDAIENFNGGTMRAPFQKGLIVTKVRFRDMLKHIGVYTINGVSVDKIAIFGDAKVFKAALGEHGLFAKFEDYCNNFERLGHRFGVLLENHGLKKTFLPSQQLNAVIGGDIEHIRIGVTQEINYLRQASIPSVAAQRYGNKFVATVGKDDPDLLKVWFVQEMMNSGYTKERLTSLSGRSHGENYTGFACKDIVAFAQWIAYCEGVRTELPTGCLEDMNIFAPMARDGMAIASRNPVIALYGLAEVNVCTKLDEEWQQFFDKDFPYIMVSLGKLSILLRMDFDGDKARLTFDKWFIDLVRSAKKNAGDEIEIFADWEGFGEAWKAVPTDENLDKFYGGATAASALGMNVATATKLATHWPEKSNVAAFQRLADYKMNQGTDVKQGADGSSAEGEVGKLWESVAQLCKKLKYTKAQAAAHELKRKQGEPMMKADKVESNWGHSPADLFNMGVAKMTSPTLHFGGNVADSVKFLDKILINRTLVIPGLCKDGDWNEETQEFENEGLFNRLCLRHNAEWKAICEDDKTHYDYKAWKTEKEFQAWHEMIEYAENLGYTEDDVYDAVTTYVFGTMAKTWYSERTTDKKRNLLMVIARQYMEWFTPELVEVYQTNLDHPLEILDPEYDIEEDPFA